LYEAIRKGKLPAEIPLTEDGVRKKLLVKLLWRIGIYAYGTEEGITAQKTDCRQETEVPVLLQDNKRVWIVEPKQEVFMEVEEKLKTVSTKIQLKNAERQVKVFNEKEEKEFGEIQNEYLRLLKSRDEILDEFYNEERMLENAFAT
jgi:hypothetical protein